jgi:hypothetical protein
MGLAHFFADWPGTMILPISAINAQLPKPDFFIILNHQLQILSLSKKAVLYEN